MYSLNKYFLSALVIISMIMGACINGLMRSNKNQILYISHEEVLEFEKKRLSSTDFQKKQLFLGRPKKAAILLQKYGESFRNSNNLVIYSVGKVVGEGSKSISAQVHELVIEELEDVRQ